MSNVSGPQQKASRVGSSVTMRASAANPSTKRTSQPARAKSIATMPSSEQFGRNANANSMSCQCGTPGHHGGKKLSPEVWDPFQFDNAPPAYRASSKDLLQSVQQRRCRPCTEAGGQPLLYQTPCPPPPPPPPAARNYCDSGENSSTSPDNGQRTTEFLHDMWCQQKLCDVVLQCRGNGNTNDSILAHKVSTRAGLCESNVSVRLSVTRRYCVKTKKASVMISSPSGSPTILVF